MNCYEAGFDLRIGEVEGLNMQTNLHKRIKNSGECVLRFLR